MMRFQGDGAARQRVAAFGLYGRDYIGALPDVSVDGLLASIAVVCCFLVCDHKPRIFHI